MVEVQEGGGHGARSLMVTIWGAGQKRAAVVMTFIIKIPGGETYEHMWSEICPL